MEGSPSPKTPDPVSPADPVGPAVQQRGFFQQWLGDWFKLRKPAPMWESFLLGAMCIGLCLAVWWFVTRGDSGEDRIIGPLTLPSPSETFKVSPELFGKELDTIENLKVTLRRVGLGFLLAIAVGV